MAFQMAQHVKVRFHGAMAPGYIEGLMPEVALVHLYEAARRVAVPYAALRDEHEKFDSHTQIAALAEALRIANTGEFPATVGYVAPPREFS